MNFQELELLCYKRYEKITNMEPSLKYFQLSLFLITSHPIEKTKIDGFRAVFTQCIEKDVI